MSIGTMCRPNVQVAYPDTEVVEAARLMRDSHVGDLVIVDRESSKTPVGMLTDRDIVVGVVAQGISIKDVIVVDVMSHSVFTASYDDDIADVTAIMRAYGLQRIPVVSKEGYLTGIFSMNEALGMLADELDKLAGLRPRSIGVEARRRRSHRQLVAR